MDFPIYYRKNGRCMKVVSPTVAKVIILPPDAEVPERFTTTYPSTERMQEDIKAMERCDSDKFKEFLFTFYRSVKDEHDQVSRNCASHLSA